MAYIIEEQTTDGGDIDEKKVYGDNWFAQSFTIGTTGDNFETTLTEVRIECRKIVAGAIGSDLILEIYEGNPSGYLIGSALSTGTIAETDVTLANKIWRIATMSPQIVLQKNKKYVLLVKTTSGDAANYYKWDAAIGTSVYAGGQGMQSTDAGVSWTGWDDYLTAGDFAFQIVGGVFDATMCTYSEAVQKVGANASTISTNEEILGVFVRQAECRAVIETRYNWIDNYSTLNDDVKKILTDYVTNQAAIYAISFDMSSFSSRLEATQMIETYEKQNKELLRLLQDQNTQKFIENA